MRIVALLACGVLAGIVGCGDKPEAPAPIYYYEDPALRMQAGEAARLTGAPLLMGGVAFTPAREPMNSAFLIDETGKLTGRYDKVRLVPFGEYIPAGFDWIQKISTEAGNYIPGAGMKVLDSCSRPMIPMRIAGMLYG